MMSMQPRYWLGFAVAMMALGIAVLSWCITDMYAASTTIREAPVEQAVTLDYDYSKPTDGLAVNVRNAAQMHAKGLPTREDVMSWHVNGRWGYGVTDGGTREVVFYDILPGGADVWDALYGFDDVDWGGE